MLQSCIRLANNFTLIQEPVKHGLRDNLELSCEIFGCCKNAKHENTVKEVKGFKVSEKCCFYFVALVPILAPL